jgi:formylglycine-generating enzyme required for sulfatase activity
VYLEDMERASIGLAALAGTSLLLVRCYLITPYSDLTSEYPPPSDDGGGDAATGDEGGKDATGGDDGGCPPKMVPVAAPGGAGVYCVGATEVTVAEYEAFQAASQANPSLVTLPRACAWKTGYSPGVHRDGGAMPITGVDWCDAYAYCAWIGGHLCGRIGGGTVVTATALVQNDAAASQWYNACSKGGVQRFPYADAYDPLACNGADLSGDGPDPSPVKSVPTCEGGYAGLFDMSGNVSEWADECDEVSDSAAACRLESDGGRTCDFCAVRGGTWRHYNGVEADHIACAAVDSDPRDHRLGELGVRCCAR